MSARTIIRTVVTPRTVTRRVGPAGADAEGGGVSAFTDLTDKASADLPAINTPLASALASLSAQLSGKAPASGIAPSAISGTAVITTDLRLSDARTPTAHTHPASEISDSTSTGRSILTAANQSAARTSGLGAGATGDLLFQALNPAAARETLGQITATSTAQIDSIAYVLGGTPVTGLQNIQLAADTLYELSWYGKFTSNGGSGYLWLNFSSAIDDLGNNAFQQFARFHTTTANPFLNSTTQFAAASANLGTQTNRTAHGSIRFKTVSATQVSLGWSQWNSGTVAGTSSLLTSFRIGIRPV